jgi:hypothetical protein
MDLQRSAAFGIGKEIAGSVYVHTSAEHVLPRLALRRAKTALPPGFRYQVVRFNFLQDQFSFVHCPDFDTQHEPVVSGYVIVRPNGSIKYCRSGLNPQVYHHKWLMVEEDYAGFSVAEARKRSALTLGIGNQALIGYRNVWVEVLKRRNIAV